MCIILSKKVRKVMLDNNSNRNLSEVFRELQESRYSQSSNHNKKHKAKNIFV